ncbi:MAG: YkvA family protein [Pyrinomonadaceae bacterium]
MARFEVRRRLKNLLMFLPNMIGLCARLMVDSRVPRAERALFAGALLYAIIPFDFIPDLIPFVGQIDDAYLIALTLLRLIEHTDDRVVREHWRGGGDIVVLAQSMAALTAKFLPTRMRRALTSQVESAPAATLTAKGKLKPIFVEVPEEREPIREAPAGRL